MAIRCARGERGSAAIRGGRRSVQLSEAGGRILWFDAAAALASPARLARAVSAAEDLEAAERDPQGARRAQRARLRARGRAQRRRTAA